ncbi:MAG: hypothetical protein H7834_04910 [Magnetococcus sp. YQC-9]
MPRLRDALLERVLDQMAGNDRLFVLSADMGAPALDRIRDRFPSRFINVGIAEQNLINVASGLAREGCTVYTLAIAAFYLRAYEQIRNNLSIAARFASLNVNMLAVGGGVSYDISGPSHHALEDLPAMRNLPDLAVISLADWFAAARFTEYALQAPQPKYLRLDSKPHEALSRPGTDIPWQAGFEVVRRGKRVALVTCGILTLKAERMIAGMPEADVGLIDLFSLGAGLDAEALARVLSGYERLITLHEGYLERGGLDTLVDAMVRRHGLRVECHHAGFAFQHHFTALSRERMHAVSGMDIETLRPLLCDG